MIMRIVAISRVRNEADIIEPFVRHTLAYCEKLLVINHGSTDATEGILRSLESEGLGLEVINDPTLGHVGVDQMNRLLNVAARELSADWIFCLDADEFISGSTDVSFLPDGNEGKTACLKMRMRTYYCSAEDDNMVLNPVDRIRRRLVHEPAQYFKVIIPGWIALQPACSLVQGNHSVSVGTREAPFEVLEDVHLAHFPLRTPSQYAIKLAAKHLQRLRGFSARSSEASFYHSAYEQLRKSYSSFAKTFLSQPLAYLPPHNTCDVVSDPIRYLGSRLRYTDRAGDLDEYSAQLLALAERLARSGSPGVGMQQDGERSPTLSVEAFPYPECGSRKEHHVQADSETTHMLDFALACSPDTAELRIRFACDPGMLEISALTLTGDGCPPVERTFEKQQLETMLRVCENGASIHSESLYRFFISLEPVLLTFRGWRESDEPPPTGLRMSVRYERRLLQGIFLDAKALNAITRERMENESLRNDLRVAKETINDLLERPKYTVGSIIDFSDHGSAIFFMGRGWSHGESWGTWTDGHQALLTMRFMTAPACDLSLHACVRGFSSDTHPVTRANVRVDGEILAAWELNGSDFQNFCVRIPAERLTRDRCEILFEMLNSIAPEEDGVSEDDRLLGLGFKSIFFERLPAITPPCKPPSNSP